MSSYVNSCVQYLPGFTTQSLLYELYACMVTVFQPDPPLAQLFLIGLNSAEQNLRFDNDPLTHTLA